MFKLKSFWLILIFIYSYSLYGSEITYCFWLPFSDKNANEHLISNPYSFLSNRSVTRRLNQNILIEFNDLPVVKEYTDSVQKLGFNIQYNLKWMNGVVVYTNDSSLILKTREISFIKTPILIGLFDSYLKSTKNKFSSEYLKYDTIFQQGFTQISLENGFYLHNKGYLGKGKLIALIDAGFYNVDILESFDSLWYNNQIKYTRDFSTIKGDFYQQHYHGMNVLSIIGGNIPGQITGSAPKADFMLLKSEVAEYEQPIEEYNWIAAAECADSAGADIINTSLGYSKYNFPFTSYTYDDMDGNTAVISRAATIASKKGMIVVVSAGNEGSNSWKYITAPADANGILSVGATNSLGYRSYFSSFGPSFDQRIKPDIMAQGSNVIIQDPVSSTITGNGTSFSAPVISGLTACLWQYYPKLNNTEIIELIKRSSSQYFNPDNEYGYGIADFYKATLLLPESEYPEIKIKTVLINNIVEINIKSFNNSKGYLYLYNSQGQLVYSEQFPISKFDNDLEIFLPDINAGIYFLNLKIDGYTDRYCLLKTY